MNGEMKRIAFDLHCGGRYLISGSQDGRALLFDIQKGVQICEITFKSMLRQVDRCDQWSLILQDNCPLRIALCSGQRHYTVAPDMEEEEPMENDHQSTSQNVVQVYKYELEFSTLFSKKNDCGKCFLTYTIDSTERSPTPTLSFVVSFLLIFFHSLSTSLSPFYTFYFGIRLISSSPARCARLCFQLLECQSVYWIVLKLFFLLLFHSLSPYLFKPFNSSRFDFFISLRCFFTFFFLFFLFSCRQPKRLHKERQALTHAHVFVSFSDYVHLYEGVTENE
ncbi:unnamed protein product [Albugo candida]|uniref:Uncharacterized protein n=1 Tax=Albugo candida TaxID=65357 RepID=A0A024GMR1_9STRA|nr:unnamed protein product [Albugo candida]|eukprot:CCI47994.1 unnamed protein product [Albugo candida]